jgi:hypothetical protein
MESLKVGTNKFLGEVFQYVSSLRYENSCRITVITTAINVHVTSCRPSSSGVTGAARGVAHPTVLHQLTVFLTSHTEMATKQI